MKLFGMYARPYPPMRVGIIALLEESNTFVGERTRWEHFESDVLLTGDAIREQFAGGNHEVSGFFAELASHGVEAAPIFAARALPYGTISADAWSRLIQLLEESVERTGPCDGYLAAAHGATVTESAPDADGEWLSQLRQRIGKATPLVSTLDPHANLSPRMVAATDALVAYRTNPHIDQFECGRRAAKLVLRTLAGEINPTQRAAYPPLMINIERQDTSATPCRRFFTLADEIERRAGVQSDSVLLGFGYADVVEMGSSALVVTDDDPELAQRYADEIAEHMWRQRAECEPKLIPVDVAIDEAIGHTGRSCLLDMGDNVGGGGPGNATWIVHALHRRRVNGAFACLCDGDAVSGCVAAGVGGNVELTIGGKSGPLHGEPFRINAIVLGLYDGRFRENEPRHGGFSAFDQGLSAVVTIAGGLTLLLTSQRMAPFSLRQLTSCGIDPRQFSVIVAKGVVAPVAAYRSVCDRFIRVNTPGVTTADVAQLPYKNRRRPLYPFERSFEWQANTVPRKATV